MISSSKRTFSKRIYVLGAVIFAATLLLSPVSAQAQDTLTLGGGTQCVPVVAGTTLAVVPVYVRDVAGTPLGIDKPAGRKLQAFGFKLTPSPVSALALDVAGSVKITALRAGLTSALYPSQESSSKTASTFGYVLQFEEFEAISFTPGAPSPGNHVADLRVTLAPGLPSGTTVSLTLIPQPRSTQFANFGGTITEEEASGTMMLVSGCIRVQ